MVALRTMLNRKKAIARERNIRVPVTDDELKMAHELADLEGTSIADALRTLIRETHAARLGKARKGRAR